MKIKRSGKQVATSLHKYGDRSTRQMRRVHVAAAKKLQEVVSKMVPFKTGKLEGNVKISESREGRRKVFTVYVDTDDVKYAIFMHERFYDLGPGSQEKQRSTEHKVGRKYITRGRQWVVEEWGYYDKMKDSVKQGRK